MGEMMNAMHLRFDSCAVCRGDRFQDWRWAGLEACCACGHVRKSSDKDRHYSDQIQEAYFDADFAWQNDLFQRFYEGLNVRRRLRELRGVMPAGRVLEVGVGHGSLLLALRSAGYRVEGVDFSRAVCTAVHAQHGLAIHYGNLEAYAQATPAGRYDAVIMCHVLEHMESPLPALQAVRHVLNPGGLLYLAVPNQASWNAYLPGWAGYEPYHIHYFSPAGLRQVLSLTGFQIVRERTFEPISGWFNAAVRSLRRFSPDLEAATNVAQHPATPNALIRTLYNGARIATGTLLSPLRWFQSALGYGEELVMIARADSSTRITYEKP